MNIKHVNVLGTRIAALNMETMPNLVSRRLESDKYGGYICVTNVYCIMECVNNSEVRSAYNQACLCVPDGMPLVWLGKLHGHKEIGRVYGPDLMLKLLELSAERGFTNYFYGGKEGVAKDLKIKMQERFPGLKVVGAYGPPFRELKDNEEKEIINEINAVRPDIIWVGIGTPKQDLLMYRWSQKGVNVKIMIGVGAAFDFHTGRVRQAPVWMQRIGMEWFFRLCMEPKRLIPRYLKNNPAFLWHAFLQLTGLRKYSIE
ncbi:WecB/TagA/CpsF family glycosyltransferase [Verrucomicrobiota bacterium]